MTPNRMFTAWLRPLAGVFAVVAALALSACGGGSGAPNNPYAPPAPVVPALVILPAAPTVYTQVASTLTISGGVAPYRAFSSNSAVLPVPTNLPGTTLTLLAAPVSASTAVTITVQDAANTTVSVDVTVLPGPASPPPALVALPSALEIYSTIAAQVSVTGGVPPYRAVSSNATILPVASSITNNTLNLLAASVSADASVEVTVQDSVAQTVTVKVVVHPKPSAPTTPVVVLPDSLTMSSGSSVTLTISGGTTPYRAYSSNPAVIPGNPAVTGSSLVLTAAGVVADTTVTITIQDAGGQTAKVGVLVKPQATTPLAVLPATAVAFSGTPTSLTVSGGVAPYTAFSSNSAVLPVAQAVAGNAIALLPTTVSADTAVTITVKDAVGSTAASAVSVRPAALLNNLTVKPNATDCGTTNAICSGQPGTASITALLPGGGAAAGRQIRFDVVAGPYVILSSNTAVQSLVVVSDASGNASVIIRANVDAPTQPAQIRATDVASGQQVTGDFLIQQRTDGTSILTVVPPEATIKGAYVGECSIGFRIQYHIYGGTPPYRITQNFPDSSVIMNPTVAASGGYFEVVTNGYCVDPQVFSIVDAAGRQTTARLYNLEGDAPFPVVEPADLSIVPADISAVCKDATFTYVVTGGTWPYNVYATPTVGSSPALSNGGIITSNGGTIKVTNVTRNVTLSFVDQSNPKKTATRTISCSDSGGSTALSVSPAFYSPTAACTTASTFDFIVSGGAAPYDLSFAGTPEVTATITKLSATQFRVSGLSKANNTTFLKLTDSSSPQQLLAPYITCP